MPIRRSLPELGLGGIRKNRAQYDRLHVGRVGADSVTETEFIDEYENWVPLKALDDHERYVLLLTAEGPYIQWVDFERLRPNDSPLGSAYYRIVDDGLTEVCRITEEVVPPPGYPIPDYVNNPERFD